MKSILTLVQEAREQRNEFRTVDKNDPRPKREITLANGKKAYVLIQGSERDPYLTKYELKKELGIDKLSPEEKKIAKRLRDKK
jgi:hypothetical protein